MSCILLKLLLKLHQLIVFKRQLDASSNYRKTLFSQKNGRIFYFDKLASRTFLPVLRLFSNVFLDVQQQFLPRPSSIRYELINTVDRHLISQELSLFIQKEFFRLFICVKTEFDAISRLHIDSNRSHDISRYFLLINATSKSIKCVFWVFTALITFGSSFVICVQSVKNECKQHR